MTRTGTENDINLQAGATWRFDTGTTDADPGNRNFRLNNATQASATFIFVNNSPESGVDASGILLALTTGDRVYIQELSDATRHHLFVLSGAAVDGTTYVKLPVTSESAGSNPLRSNRSCGLVAHT